jgi:hypothetical protein
MMKRKGKQKTSDEDLERPVLVKNAVEAICWRLDRTSNNTAFAFLY